MKILELGKFYPIRGGSEVPVDRVAVPKGR